MWIQAVGGEAVADQGFPAHFLRHALDLDEPARVAHDDTGATLVVLRVPDGDGRAGRSTTLAIMWRGERIATVSAVPLALVADAAARLGPAPAPFAVLLELVRAVSAAFLARLDRIDAEVERLEEDLKTSLRNEEVLGLLECQKALVHLERALLADQVMLERLRDDPRVALDDDARRRLDEALVELRQAIHNTTISAEILASMMDAFASIISNNLNHAMKLMAALTVMLAIPTMIAGLWGMNVPMPGDRSAWAFGILVAVAVSLSLAVGVLFRRRRWL